MKYKEEGNDCVSNVCDSRSFSTKQHHSWNTPRFSSRLSIYKSVRSCPSQWTFMWANSTNRLAALVSSLSSALSSQSYLSRSLVQIRRWQYKNKPRSPSPSCVSCMPLCSVTWQRITSLIRSLYKHAACLFVHWCSWYSACARKVSKFGAVPQSPLI